MNKKIILIPSNEDNHVTILRCKKALELWQTNKYDFVVVSGFLIHTSLMRKWLVQNGIEETKILNESNSCDTYTNVHYSLKLLKEKNINIESLTIVSHQTHLRRLKVIFWRNYRIKPICVAVEYKLKFRSWLYEIIQLLYVFLDKTGNGFPEKIIRTIVRNKFKTL